MATSSVEKSSTEYGLSVFQASAGPDSDDGESSPRSPSVREFVASFELQRQQHQHRPLCRTDVVGRHQPARYHERPQPPYKTTTAVLKARHLRAASEDLSSSDWHSDVITAGKSVSELKIALLNSTKLQTDQNRRSSDIDIGDRNEPISRSPGQNSAVTSEFDQNENDGGTIWTEAVDTSSGITVMRDSAVDFQPHPSSSDVDGEEMRSHSATNNYLDAVDSTGDDVGYFSLPGRRPARDGRHHAARSRSESWNGPQNSSIVDDDDAKESALAYSSNSAGSLSPGSQIRGRRHAKVDASSFLGSSCLSEDEQCQSTCEGPQDDAEMLPIAVSSGDLVSDDCSSPSDVTVTAYNQRSDKFEADVDNQANHDEGTCGSVVVSTKLEPERLSEILMESFGRSDAALCQAVGTIASHRTALSYVSSLFAESRLVRRCSFDLTRPYQLDPSSTCVVQFLTIDAVREAARRYMLLQRDELVHIREATDDDVRLLSQLEARVTEVIKCKTDSRQLDKYHQYVDEMERVTRLLLLLAGRLARLDNSVQQLPLSGDSQRIIRNSLMTNRDELAEKFADASTLKSDIDRRGRTISDLFASSLTADEFADFKRLMAEKTRLRLQRQELEDWSRLADQQLNELSVDIDDSPQDAISHC